jgi:hypothetical protein
MKATAERRHQAGTSFAFRRAFGQGPAIGELSSAIVDNFKFVHSFRVDGA